MGDEEDREGRGPGGRSRIPPGSVFYSKIIPIVLIGLGILTAVLIIVAAGVLLGFVPYH